MKNRIYKAISEGVMNALSVDIPDQDIDFDKDNIDNEFIFPKLVNKFIDIYKTTVTPLLYIDRARQDVKELVYSFNTLNDYIVKPCPLYQVKDIDELDYMLGKGSRTLHDALKIYYNNETSDDILKFLLYIIDISNIFTVITDSGQECSIQDCNEKARFLKIKDPKFTSGQYDNTILFEIEDNDNELEYDETIWKEFTLAEYTEASKNKDNGLDKNAAEKDFNGWSNTYKNKNIDYNDSDSLENYPAIQSIISNPKIYSGYDAYIPSAGQIAFLDKYKKLISYICKYLEICGCLKYSCRISKIKRYFVYGDFVEDFLNDPDDEKYVISSTEYNDSNVYVYNIETSYSGEDTYEHDGYLTYKTSNGVGGYLMLLYKKI